MEVEYNSLAVEYTALHSLYFMLQLEISVGEDIVNDEYLYSEVHPAKNVVKQAFAKPKGPARRGPKRMTKPDTTS